MGLSYLPKKNSGSKLNNPRDDGPFEKRCCETFVVPQPILRLCVKITLTDDNAEYTKMHLRLLVIDGYILQTFQKGGGGVDKIQRAAPITIFQN